MSLHEIYLGPSRRIYHFLFLRLLLSSLVVCHSTSLSSSSDNKHDHPHLQMRPRLSWECVAWGFSICLKHTHDYRGGGGLLGVGKNNGQVRVVVFVDC